MTLVREGVADVVLIQDCSNPTCTVLRLSLGSSDIIFINVYFKYADRIEVHIDHLENILNRFRGETILIAADVKARSLLWHNATTDERGEELETFISSYDMIIFNCQEEVSTYENTWGHCSNIDVTLGSGSQE